MVGNAACRAAWFNVSPLSAELSSDHKPQSSLESFCFTDKLMGTSRILGFLKDLIFHCNAAVVIPMVVLALKLFWSTCFSSVLDLTRLFSFSKWFRPLLSLHLLALSPIQNEF